LVIWLADFLFLSISPMTQPYEALQLNHDPADFGQPGRHFATNLFHPRMNIAMSQLKPPQMMDHGQYNQKFHIHVQKTPSHLL